VDDQRRFRVDALLTLAEHGTDRNHDETEILEALPVFSEESDERLHLRRRLNDEIRAVQTSHVVEPRQFRRRRTIEVEESRNSERRIGDDRDRRMGQRLDRRASRFVADGDISAVGQGGFQKRTSPVRGVVPAARSIPNYRHAAMKSGQRR
jgi:hypothetical protein